MSFARSAAPELAAAGEQLCGASPDADTVTDVRLSASADLSTLEREWRAFEAHADCTVFQSYQWLSTWQKHIGTLTGTIPAIVCGYDSTDTLLFVIPLAVRSEGFIRQLSFLGHELCDYNAPLLNRDFWRSPAAGNFPALWARIRQTLQADPRFRHDMILLDKMPERVGNQPNPFLTLDVALNPSGAYQTDLAPDWDTFYAAKRTASSRKRDRSKRKKLAEAGDIRAVTPESSEDIARTFAALLSQKRKALARLGVADFFARPGYTQFFRALTEGGPSIAHLGRLDVGATEAAATNLGLMFRGSYYHVLTSYDDGPLSRLGPGSVHLQELMRYAIAHHCTKFDFTIGDERYKREWCDIELKLFDHISAVTARGLLFAMPAAVYRRTKRAIKQSSVLWPLFMRGRAATASWRQRSAGPHPDQE